MTSPVSQKIIFIVGATGAGKTDIALKLAAQWPCEILSCDSMQVYREISIASSKPSLQERQQVSHHLLDVVSVEEKFDVAVFNKMARGLVEQILKDKKIPLIVGGSGMYVQVLLDGIFEGSIPNTLVRQNLEARAKKEGAAVLYEELKITDPDAAAKIHVHDVRRTIRALEVFQTTQTPLSKLQKNCSGLWNKYSVTVFGIEREREELYERINARVEKMFAEGIIDEVKAIEDRNISLTARRIIGVREILAHLKGEGDLNEVKELIKMNTRRFAKRQLTWFRKDKRIHWIAVRKDESSSAVAAKILGEIKNL